MKIYELTYLMPLDLADEETRILQERINSYISENQGTLDKVEDMEKKRLGEPIKNQNMAKLVSLIFRMNQEKIEDLEKKIKSEKQVIHHMILNKKIRKMTDSPRRMRQMTTQNIETESKIMEKPKKVEIKEIEKKLEEILGE